MNRLALKKNQVERRRDSAFAILAASPHDFGALAVEEDSEALFLPHGADLAVTTDAALDAGAFEILQGGEVVFTSPELEANETYDFLGYFEKGRPVVLRRGTAEDAALLQISYMNGFGRPVVIAEAELS